MTDTTATVVMWVGVVLAIVISSTWFVLQLKPAQNDLGAIQHDLEQLSVYLDRACNSVSYSRIYNPRVERGTLSINATFLCINSTTLQRCTKTPCTTAENEFTLDISEIVIEKTQNPQLVSVQPR